MVIAAAGKSQTSLPYKQHPVKHLFCSNTELQITFLSSFPSIVRHCITTLGHGFVQKSCGFRFLPFVQINFVLRRFSCFLFKHFPLGLLKTHYQLLCEKYKPRNMIVRKRLTSLWMKNFWGENKSYTLSNFWHQEQTVLQNGHSVSKFLVNHDFTLHFHQQYLYCFKKIRGIF